MYCELADLDEWVVLNESVMMADCNGGRFSVSKLLGPARLGLTPPINRETYVYEIISTIIDPSLECMMGTHGINAADEP